MRDAINASSAGVTAAIVYTGSAYELTISSDATGAENSVAITVDDDDGTDTNTSGLSALAFSSAATNLSQSQAVQMRVSPLMVSRLLVTLIRWMMRSRMCLSH